MADVTSPDIDPGTPETPDWLVAGRAALDRHAWQEAVDLMAAVDHEATLAGADLERLAQAAFFAARPDLHRDAMERAFQAHLAEGDETRAAYLAIDIARTLFIQRKDSIAHGWLRRAERILGDEGDTYAHGYLVLAHSEGARAVGDIDRALLLAERAVELGERATDLDLKAYALSNLGELKIATGSTPDGLAMLEEASVAAVSGELSPLTSGITACRMISACRDLTDYRRASEWIEATERYCERQSVAGFPGVCRIHRAEIVALGGAWERAEEELERATVELGTFNATPSIADGYYTIGDIRRQKGDFAGAEAALREAHARGRSPHPALALVRLAEGNVKAATGAIKGALTEESWSRVARTRLLPAHVEIALAAGDVATARAAIEELSELVDEYPSPALEAGRHVALGRVLIGEGAQSDGVTELRAAIRTWREIGAPYEVARARALLARALRILDDEEGADLELNAALEEFQRLGARVDAVSAERELRAATDRRSGPVTARRTFMFTDIVGSTNLAEALGDQAWERLLRWHDDTLRGIVTKGAGEIVNSTGDGFFVAFGSAAEGVRCAIAIQTALRDHRGSTGFAPSVRIGLHAADATRRGDDYSGMGVHLAARVAALAGAGEIVATAETLAEAGAVAVSDAREATVKGVTTPVAIASIAWQ